MAITINHLTKVISVPQADLTLVTGSLYELNTETDFRQTVIALLDDEDGIVLEDAIDHNTEYSVAGVTYARKIEVINGYSVQFTPDSQWSVRLAGSNNNIFDVENGVLVQNQVQVIANNSAGLQTVSSGSGLDAGQDAKLTNINSQLTSIEDGKDHSWFMRIILSALSGLLSGADPGKASDIVTRDILDTKDRIKMGVDGKGNRTLVITLDGD
jgi:hypothetical protein